MSFSKANYRQLQWKLSSWQLDNITWRHNEAIAYQVTGISIFLLNRLFRRKSKKTSKLSVTCLCEGESPVTDEFPAQRPVTRKMLPSEDVIMIKWFEVKFVLMETCWFCRWWWWLKYVFSCDQAAIWLVQSVRPSVRLSVRPSVRPSVCLSVTPFSPCSHHRIIM